MEGWKKAGLGIATGIAAFLFRVAIKHGVSSTDLEDEPTIAPDDLADDPEVFEGVTNSKFQDIVNKVAKQFNVAKVRIDGKTVEMNVRSHSGRGTWLLRTSFNDDGSIDYDNCANPYAANIGVFIWRELARSVKEAIQSKRSHD